MSLFGKKSLSNVRELQGDKLILRLETLQRHQESLMRQMGLVVQSTRGNVFNLQSYSEFYSPILGWGCVNFEVGLKLSRAIRIF